MSKLTWNYRVIVNDLRSTPWMAIYTVYYLNGEPFDHSVSASTAAGDEISDVTEGLAKLHSALNKPILKMSEFPSAVNYRRGEWLATGNSVAEWQD